MEIKSSSFLNISVSPHTPNLKNLLVKCTELQVDELYRVWSSTKGAKDSLVQIMINAKENDSPLQMSSPMKNLLTSPVRGSPLSPIGRRGGSPTPPLSPSAKGASLTGSSNNLVRSMSSPPSPRHFGAGMMDDNYPSVDQLGTVAALSDSKSTGTLPFSPTNSGRRLSSGPSSPSRDSNPLSPTAGASSLSTSSPGIAIRVSPGAAVASGTLLGTSNRLVSRSYSSDLSSSTQTLSHPAILSPSRSFSSVTGLPSERDQFDPDGGFLPDGSDGSFVTGDRALTYNPLSPTKSMQLPISPRLLRSISAPISTAHSFSSPTRGAGAHPTPPGLSPSASTDSNNSSVSPSESYTDASQRLSHLDSTGSTTSTSSTSTTSGSTVVQTLTTPMLSQTSSSSSSDGKEDDNSKLDAKVIASMLSTQNIQLLHGSIGDGIPQGSISTDNMMSGDEKINLCATGRLDGLDENQPPNLSHSNSVYSSAESISSSKDSHSNILSSTSANVQPRGALGIPKFYSKKTGPISLGLARKVTPEQPAPLIPSPMPLPKAASISQPPPRGKPLRQLPNQTLEEQLSGILELFRGHNAAGPAPLHPYARANAKVRASTSSNLSNTGSLGKTELDSANFFNVNVLTSGVTISWEDAHLGIAVDNFAAIAKPLCGFPSFFAAPLYRRIVQYFNHPSNNGGRPVIPAFMVTEGATVADSPDPRQAYVNLKAPEFRGKDINSVPPQTITIVYEPEVAKAENDDPNLRDTSGTVSLPLFLSFWRHELEQKDHTERFFRLVKQRRFKYIIAPDFMPFLEELLAYHPGLAFLESTPEFQEKYARTIIARIFYICDTGCRQMIEESSLRHSSVIPAFNLVDVEEDINLVNEFFSYEHFYVLYCKFWELDSDHDFFVTRADLSRLGNLTPFVLDRVMGQCGRPFISASNNPLNPQVIPHPSNPEVPFFPSANSSPDSQKMMSFEDFCIFYLASEDKTTVSSLRYWFNVCDIDCDGYLTKSDLKPIYEEQSIRMRDFGLEVVLFDDVLCQLHDLLKPKIPGRIAFSDFIDPTRIKLSGALFNALFDIEKFQRFENRDPQLVKQSENYLMTQWDRFASIEYQRLANEEEDAKNLVASPGNFGNVGAINNMSW